MADSHLGHKNMNDLQKVEFDLFCCFEEVCRKLNLNYFLVCGSALGAARHEGVIPWDDDFDVGMYREDYNKFMELAPALLPEGIFLQNYKSDPEYPLVFAKLRNSNTTYIESLFSKMNMNHGVYLDIFPLDGCPEDACARKKLNARKRRYLRRIRCAYNMPKTISLRGKIGVALFRMLGYHKRTAQTLAKYEALISQYSVKGTKLICNHGTWYGERDYIPVEFYGKGSLATYEGMTVRVPEKCDEYLTALYGDWRTPPPPEKRKGSHKNDACDTTKSYTEYFK